MRRSMSGSQKGTRSVMVNTRAEMSGHGRAVVNTGRDKPLPLLCRREGCGEREGGEMREGVQAHIANLTLVGVGINLARGG
jgi:hypothetical protein